MKLLLILSFSLTLFAFAEDKEGDLQLPVSDISEIQKEEEKKLPTLDEVPMKDDKRLKTEKIPETEETKD